MGFVDYLRMIMGWSSTVVVAIDTDVDESDVFRAWKRATLAGNERSTLSTGPRRLTRFDADTSKTDRA